MGAGANDIDEDGRLPLHLACANEAPADVVAAVLGAHREGEAGWVGRGCLRVVRLRVFRLLFLFTGGSKCRLWRGEMVGMMLVECW